MDSNQIDASPPRKVNVILLSTISHEFKSFVEGDDAMAGEATPRTTVQCPKDRSQLTDALMARRSKLPNLMNEEQAMMNFVKGMAGTGDLSLPLAFCNAGLWTGFGCIIVIIIINSVAMHLLVRSSQKLCYVYKRQTADFGETVELSMKYASPTLGKYGKWGRRIVNLFLAVDQVGTVCIYYLFIAENLKEGADPCNNLSLNAAMGIILVPLLLLCSIRHLKYLSFFSAFANVVLSVAFLIMFQYMFTDLPPWQRLPAFNSWSTFPLFFGSAMFAFQGINTICAIENRTIRPHGITNWNGVLNTSCVLVAVLYVALGFFGYLKFGDKVHGTVTLNLPLEEPLYQAAKLMFAVSIFFTYPVQFYIPISVVVAYTEKRLGPGKKQLVVEYAIRYLTVLFTLAVAALLPHLGLVISLIGSLATSALALTFPGLVSFFTNYYGKEHNAKWYGSVCLTVFLSIYGVVGMVIGSYVAIVQLIEAVGRGGYS